MGNRVIVIGGGISGLVAAWYLKLKGREVTLLEASSRVGGWIESVRQDGFLFEMGPRSCRAEGNGAATLALIEKLGLQADIIAAAPAAKRRFLYTKRKLQAVPSGPLSLLTSPLTRPLAWPLLREWNIRPSEHRDESVHDFVERRLGSYAATTFADCLVSGIYAGDPTRLSVKSCFPLLYEWERKHGSILKGMLASRTKGGKHGVFSLRKGMQQLVDALDLALGTSVKKNSAVVSIDKHESALAVHTKDGHVHYADHLVSALPASALAPLMVRHDHELARLLQSIHSTSVAVVALGYRARLLEQEGYGYLIPANEGERVLGVIWDSSVFPQQNHLEMETRLTCMIGGERMPNFDSYDREDFVAMALEAIGRQLGKKRTPDGIAVKITRGAIPQYYLGHESCLQAIERRRELVFPNMTLIGSSFHGVSVNDCIANAQSAAIKIGIEEPVFA